MTDKELKKLKRTELLQILLDLSVENKSLKEENGRLKQELNDRNILIEESGSIAEASLRINNVFRAAQDAADQYLFNMKQRCRTADTGSESRLDGPKEPGTDGTEKQGNTDGN
jgi:hypothetical protein